MSFVLYLFRRIIKYSGGIVALFLILVFIGINKQLPISISHDRILSKNQSNDASSDYFSNDSILYSIELPYSGGGVVFPNNFIYNTMNDEMYITGYQNIAICDGTTGELQSFIKTDREHIDVTYCETYNKLYCANSYVKTVDVIDCQTYQVIKTIVLQDTITSMVWNDSLNFVYCTQHSPQQGNSNIQVIDCATDSVIEVINISGYPKQLFYNAANNKLYCANYGILDIVDANNNSILNQIPLDSTTQYMFFYNSVANKIYCVSKYHGRVSIIDGLSDTLITRLSLGSWTSCASYNPVRNCCYFGHIYSMDIYTVDGATDSIINITPFNAAIPAIAFDSTDNRLFAISSPSTWDMYDDLIVIDGSTNTIIDTLEVGVSPQGIIWEKRSNQIWIANTGVSNFPGYTVDGFKSDNLEHSFKEAIGFTPFSAIMNPVTGKYYCVGRSDNLIAVININNPDTCKLMQTGQCAWDLLFNSIENKIYCANLQSKDILVLDGSSDSILTRIPLNTDPFSLLLNEIHNKVYVATLASMVGGYIVVIDGQTDSIIKSISVPMYPYSMLWNSIDNKLYVASLNEKVITILDANADSIITSISVPSEPWSLIHNSINDKIYCTLTAGIIVIDGVTNQVVKTINTSYRPFTLDYNAMDNKVYCAGENPYIQIIDGSADSIINTIYISGEKFSLLYNPLTNTVFCAHLDQTLYPPREAVSVIDGQSDEILGDFIIESKVSWYGGFGCFGSSRKALLLDSLNNIVYLNHYFSSKISVFDGTTGSIEYASNSEISPLVQIFPNPINKTLNVRIINKKGKHISIKLYDATGRLVENLLNRISIECINEYNILPKTSCSGIYFIEIDIDGHMETHKFVMIK